MKKTLILANGFTGHALEITPLLRAAARQGAVHIVTDEAQQQFLNINNNISERFLVTDDNTDTLAVFLEKQHYDDVVVLHPTKFSEKVLQFYPKSVPAKGLFARFLGAFRKPSSDGVNISKLFSEKGWERDNFGLDYVLEKKDEIKPEDLPHSHAAGFYCVVLDNENMAAFDFVEFFKGIDHPVVLMGTGNAAYNAKRIAELDPVKIYNACGKFSFNEMADIICKSKLVVTGVNDLFYIAIACNKKVILTGKGKENLKQLSSLYPTAAPGAKPNLAIDTALLNNKGQQAVTEMVRAGLFN